MNYPARQGIACVQNYFSDNTPRGFYPTPFTLTNCDGYLLAEIHALNDEFKDRYDKGDWHGLSLDEAMKAFQDEVAGR